MYIVRIVVVSSFLLRHECNHCPELADDIELFFVSFGVVEHSVSGKHSPLSLARWGKNCTKSMHGNLARKLGIG